MSLGDLLTTKRAEEHPILVAALSMAVTLIAFLVSYFLFPSASGLVVVFLITISMVPLFNLMLEFEEMKDDYSKTNGINFFRRHSDIIRVYTAFFFGTSLAFAGIVALSPAGVAETVMPDQVSELGRIQSTITGNFFNSDLYSKIVANNLRVVGIAFVLSFLFGTGALYVLSWNASILGLLIGNLSKSSGIIGFGGGFLAFLPHGVLEVSGFFLSGIAAAILSKSVFHRKSGAFWFIIRDGAMMFALAIMLIFIAAAVEVSFI